MYPRRHMAPSLLEASADPLYLLIEAATQRADEVVAPLRARSDVRARVNNFSCDDLREQQVHGAASRSRERQLGDRGAAGTTPGDPRLNRPGRGASQRRAGGGGLGRLRVGRAEGPEVRRGGRQTGAASRTRESERPA